MSDEHNPSLVWIAEGTVQWEAWREHRTNRGLKMPEPFEVKGESGAVIAWMIEGGSPNQLIKNGVTKNTLAIGTELVIEGYQAKDGTNKGVGRNLLLGDGRRLLLYSRETEK